VGQAVVVEGRERAHGVELAARRVEGRWTLAAGYAYGVARGEALGLRFPTAEDRRHTLDVTTMVRATRTLRVGAAYASAAGSPYTRRLIVPDATGWAVHADGPNAQRLPSYASLDLVLDWSGQVGGARVGTFVQLHNALGRRNPTGYQGPSHCMGTTRPGAPCPVVDTFEDGLPIVPVLGLRLTF
jgi:hypothetical protein